ncbi:acyloxyacyl hydrolase [Nonlabens agnitus]|nr:acyloxyacyl hydrolase [Nonlabens agnitus]
MELQTAPVQMVPPLVIEDFSMQQKYLWSSLSRKRHYPQFRIQTTVLFLICLLIAQLAIAQIETVANDKGKRIGLNLGYSQQDRPPFNDEDYAHITRSIKIQLAQKVWKKDRQALEILIEPSVYYVNHQLLNLFFIKPDKPNFEAQRALFTQNRSYEEYALNLGLSYSYNLTYDLLAYGLVSIGPMTATADTERQKKGFSFSDVLGAGMRYRIENLSFDLRFSLRHVSNANLRSPNNGHNSAGVELGFSYHL